MRQKNLLLAFLLGFFPGLGHIYLGRYRGLLYMAGVFGSLAGGFLLVFTNLMYDADVMAVFFSAFVWAINMLDLIIIIIRRSNNSVAASATNEQNDGDGIPANQVNNFKTQTIVLSFIPGAGHLNLGLMNRGLTFLVGFFGILAMVFFVTILTHQGEFLVFLVGLPVIWIYNFFDAMKLINQKERGEDLQDKSLFEDFENIRADGKKNKVFATILSVFPGAGHMYIGLQRRGLQLMIAFVFTIYILDVLRLGIFLFLIPIIWFYSFFDALQQFNKDPDDLEDKPVIDYLINHQRWVGIGLLLLGAYYIVDRILVPIADRAFARYFDIHSLFMYYHNYFQTGVVSFILVLGGIKLIAGSRNKKKERGTES